MRNLVSSLACLALAACAAPGPKIVNQGCGCSGYMAETPRPAWVDGGDTVTPSLVASQGSTQCTGLKQIDLDAADLSARSKLSRIINVETDIALTETRTDVGFGVGRSQARIEASEISKVVLEGSRIAARWTDPQTCRIYARAELPRAQMEKTKARLAAEEAARLVNQTFFITSDDSYAASLNAGIAEALSAAGVSRIVTEARQDAYRAVARLTTIEMQGNGLTARLGLTLLAPNGDTVWSQTVPARAASYSQKSKNALIDRAIRAGLRNMAPKLRAALVK